MWMVLTLIFFLIIFAVGIIPVIGSLLMLLIVPVLAGGLMTGCQAVARGADLELSHLFAGFRHHTGQLMLLGLIAFGLTLAASIPLIALMGAGGFAGATSGTIDAALLLGTSALIAILIALALFVPVNMALWFAPALVMLQGETAPRSVAESFKGCLRNIVPFLVYGLIVFVLAILAALPLGLGWFVLAPVLFGSVYAAYRDIYFKR
jgi:uncharacterized membrane protein